MRCVTQGKDWQDVCLSGSLCVDAEIFHTNGTKQPAKTASVVVSTSSIALQKAILSEYVPFLSRVFGRAGHYSDTTSGQWYGKEKNILSVITELEQRIRLSVTSRRTQSREAFAVSAETL